MMDCTTMIDGMGMMGMMVWGLLSMLLALVVLFLFILAAAYGVKWVWGQRPSSTTGHGESALDLVKKRYAKGEISREAFERIKKEIE
jgi:putative membrane protein